MGIYTKSKHIEYIEPVLRLGITNIYPRLNGILSQLDRERLSYLVGKVKAEGPGQVKLVTPYVGEKKKEFILPNVCYNFFPLAIVEAIPEEGKEFKYWKLGNLDRKVFSSRLVLTDQTHEDVLLFTAYFE